VEQCSQRDSLSANAGEESFPGTNCSIDFNGQQIIRRGQALNNALARTVICVNPSDQYGRWWITIDPDYTWYTGSGDAPAGQQHLRGVMTHEFGHATGFGSGSNGTGPGHFPESDNNACPSLASDRATMCVEWGGIYQSVQHYMASLEPHDTHTFLNVY
jgi:hypothetical protein